MTRAELETEIAEQTAKWQLACRNGSDARHAAFKKLRALEAQLDKMKG